MLFSLPQGLMLHCIPFMFQAIIIYFKLYKMETADKIFIKYDLQTTIDWIVKQRSASPKTLFLFCKDKFLYDISLLLQIPDRATSQEPQKYDLAHSNPREALLQIYFLNGALPRDRDSKQRDRRHLREWKKSFSYKKPNYSMGTDNDAKQKRNKETKSFHKL